MPCHFAALHSLLLLRVSMAQSMSLLQVDVKKGKTVSNLMDTPFPVLDDYADAGIFSVCLIDVRTFSYVQSLVLLSANYNVPTALPEERARTFQDALDKLFEDQSDEQNTEYFKALEKLLASYYTIIWGVSGASGMETVRVLKHSCVSGLAPPVNDAAAAEAAADGAAAALVPAPAVPVAPAAAATAALAPAPATTAAPAAAAAAALPPAGALLLLGLLWLCPQGGRQHSLLMLLPSVAASPELEE